MKSQNLFKIIYFKGNVRNLSELNTLVIIKGRKNGFLTLILIKN
jgi:hypothetical protein